MLRLSMRRRTLMKSWVYRHSTVLYSLNHTLYLANETLHSVNHSLYSVNHTLYFNCIQGMNHSCSVNHALYSVNQILCRITEVRRLTALFWNSYCLCNDYNPIRSQTAQNITIMCTYLKISWHLWCLDPIAYFGELFLFFALNYLIHWCCLLMLWCANLLFWTPCSVLSWDGVFC